MACLGLYIHIPFCERKCPYCDFYSLPADEEHMNLYTDAVCDAIAAEPFFIRTLDTIYFGGGTPSVLGGTRLARILEAVARHCTILADAEITVEINPHSALAPSLRLMHSAGVNRLSIGMQSSNDILLSRLGRLHTATDVKQAVDMAGAAGFSHFSLDMMLATPGQTNREIENDVAFCQSLGAEHVSAYLLKIEPGTAFDREQVGALCPDDDGQADAYLFAVDALKRCGYEQYEISNFAKDGHVARHNLKYWNCEEYLGIGPSAHSFVNGNRFYFPRDLMSFLTLPGHALWERRCADGKGGTAEEYLMLRLRLSDGVEWSKFLNIYPNYDCRKLSEKADKLALQGLLQLDRRGIRLTPRGFLVSNAILAVLLEGDAVL